MSDTNSFSAGSGVGRVLKMPLHLHFIMYYNHEARGNVINIAYHARAQSNDFRIPEQK